MNPMFRCVVSLAGAAALLAGCPNVEDPQTPENDQEVVTTVSLTFTPESGGSPVTVRSADPENDGAPVIDPITLTAGTTYGLSIAFLNEQAEPAEDLTIEVEEEGEEHQVLVFGDGVEGPATGANPDRVVTHAYADEDANGLPIGIANTVVAVTAGTGSLQVMLRHLPPENDVATKTDTIAADFAGGGSASIPGDVDADVTFPLTVE